MMGIKNNVSNNISSLA